MKHLPKLLIVLFFLVFNLNSFAQQNYTVNGNNYALKTEVEGSLTLLWNVIDGNYRYFVKKDNEIVELLNTKSNGKYQEEYKQTLVRLTSDSPVDPSKTNFTLVSLRSFFNTYNKSTDVTFVEKETSVGIE